MDLLKKQLKSPAPTARLPATSVPEGIVSAPKLVSTTSNRVPGYLPQTTTSAPSKRPGESEKERYVVELFTIGKPVNIQEFMTHNKKKLLPSLSAPMDAYGNTPLHLAVSQNDYLMTCVLLSKGANPNVTNRAGISPTHIAKRLNLTNLLNVLIKHGGHAPQNVLKKADSSTRNNRSISMIIKEENERLASAQSLSSLSPSNTRSLGRPPRPSSQNELVDPDVNKRPTTASISDDSYLQLITDLQPHKKLPFHVAVYLNALENTTTKWTSQPSKYVTEVDRNGATPLMKAAYQGHETLVRLLVQHGAKVNAMDSMGFSALTWAALQGRWNIVEYLLSEASANPNGMMILMDPTKHHQCAKMSPLVAACYRGHVDIVRELLSRGADVNQRVGGTIEKAKSPLMIAACFRHEEVVRLLLKHNAKIDPSPDTWVKSGVLFLKKIMDDQNLWFTTSASATSPGTASSSPFDLPNSILSARRSSGNGATGLLTTKPGRSVISNAASLKEKLAYFSLEENEQIAIILQLLANFGNNVNGGVSTGHNKSNLSSEYDVSMDDTRLRKKSINKKRLSVRQGSNLEILFGNRLDMVTEFIDNVPETGTDLDFLCLSVFQCVVHLVLAANKTGKHKYVPISAKENFHATEMIRAIESLEAKDREWNGGNTPTTTVPSNHHPAKDNVTPFFANTAIRARMRELVSILQMDLIKQLMFSTRIAIGVWPPPHAVSDMLLAAISVARACREVADLGNTTGFWALRELKFEMQLSAFEDDSTDMSSTNTSSSAASTHSLSSPNAEVSLRKLDYQLYKRQQDIKQLEEMSKTIDKNHNNTSSDGLLNDDELEDDSGFFDLLDGKLKQFVASVQEVKRVHEYHIQEEFMSATSSIQAGVETIIEEIKQYDLLIDMSDSMVLEKEEFTAANLPIQVHAFPVLVKMLLKQIIEEAKLAAKQVAAKGKVASGAWPPPTASLEMLQSTIPCVLAVKKLVALAKACATKIRRTSSEERKKREKWRKECMQNERVKDLFHLWERQLGANKSVAVNADQTTTAAQQAQMTIEESKLLEDSADGLLWEENKETGKMVLKGATLPKIAEKMAHHKEDDLEFVNTVLLTHHSFTTSLELLDTLIKRYDITPPYGLTQQMFEFYIKTKIVPIRRKVVEILIRWIEGSFEEDFMENIPLILKAKEFADKKIFSDFESLANALLKILNDRCDRPRKPRYRALDSLKAVPRPILPKQFTPTSHELEVFLFETPRNYLEMDPLEFARQLTLIEYEDYRNVRPHECLDQIWFDKKKKERLMCGGAVPPATSINIMKMIRHTNTMSTWIASSILSMDDLKDRVTALRFFIQMAVHCRDLNNFNGVTAIVGGLTMAAIRRLGRTWRKLQQKHAKVAEEYEVISSLVSPKGQYANYRKALKAITLPVIPFLGVYLTDLTFIELANPDFIPDTHLINLDKRMKIASIIKHIQEYQQTPYSLAPVLAIQEFLKKVGTQTPGGLSPNQPILSDDEMYERSLIVEPREVETDDEDDMPPMPATSATEQSVNAPQSVASTSPLMNSDL